MIKQANELILYASKDGELAEEAVVNQLFTTAKNTNSQYVQKFLQRVTLTAKATVKQYLTVEMRHSKLNYTNFDFKVFMLHHLVTTLPLLINLSFGRKNRFYSGFFMPSANAINKQRLA